MKPVPIQVYLVERYLPGMTEQQLRPALRRVARQCARLRAGGDAVRYDGSTFLPAEETCLCRFEAERPELIWQASAAAGVPVSRITAASAMAGEAWLRRGRPQ